MTQVLLVDDQEMIRVGLRAILESDPELEVVGDVGDGFAALAFLREREVDVVLMDIRMPGIDGVETTRRIRESTPSARTRIVVLTTFELDDTVLAALRAGANGFLGKGIGPASLIAGVKDVASGGGALSGVAAAALIDQVKSAPRAQADPEAARRFAGLTPRERDVVIALAGGRDNDAVAAELYISPFTVKTHASRAMVKVGARDRVQLVALAYQAGVVPPPT